MAASVQPSSKKCSACGSLFPLSAFNRATKSRDGRAATCRRCASANRAGHKARSKDALRAAIKAGDSQKVKAILARGTVAVEPLLAIATQNYNTAPKHEGHMAIVDLLLAKGAKPNRLAIFEAARDGCQAIVERLISGGAELDIFTAAAIGDSKLVARLLKHDPQLAHTTASSGTRHYQDFSPLHCCCMSALARTSPARATQFVEVGKLLVKHGADADAKAKFYGPLVVTPLDMAAHTGGNLELCRYLIDAGATMSGFAFVEALSHRGRSIDDGLALASLFLEKGFAVDTIAWKEEGTALHGAANTASLDVARWLLQHGANVNARGRMGRTPLHLAAERNTSSKMVDVLLEAGANIRAKDDEGLTPLDIAQQYGRSVVVTRLKAELTKR
jgi:ankyrin repeat protein